MSELEMLLIKSIELVNAKKAGERALKEPRPRLRRYRARLALARLEAVKS